jgi:hypothetical protein
MMYVLCGHSVWRWLVLLALSAAIFRAAWGRWRGARFTAFDNALRHWTATIAHLQLLLGMTLFVKNPVWDRFRIIHMTGMITAVTVMTIGSALAKRRAAEAEKWGTMFRWFLAALLVIVLLIPWPFSPLAHRPLLRTF